MKLEPVSDRILVKVLEADSKTTGGIFLPDSAKSKLRRAKVVATGEGKILDNGDRREMVVSKGDTVIFNQGVGIEVEVEGKKMLLMRELDVLAKVR